MSNERVRWSPQWWTGGEMLMLVDRCVDLQPDCRLKVAVGFRFLSGFIEIH